MELPKNIADAEPWNEDDRIAPGIYAAKIVGSKEAQSKQLNPMLVVTWRIESGEWRGSEIDQKIPLLESTAGKIVALLAALEIAVPSDGILDPNVLVGKQATIVVRNDPYRGSDGEMRDWSIVKGVRPPTSDNGSDVPSGGFQPAGGVSNDDVPF